MTTPHLGSHLRSLPVNSMVHLTLVAALALGAAAPAAAQATKTPMTAPPKVIPPAPFIPPTPRQVRLATGMRFAFVPRAGTRLIDATLVFENAGAAYEIGPKGAVSMAADLMLEGTKSKSATELADAIALLGGHISTSCGLLTCRASAHAPVNQADELLTLMFEIVSAPRFDDEALARLKEERKAGFAARKDDPKAISAAAVKRIRYGSHPLGQDSAGTPASVAALTRDDVVAAWKRVFHRGNAKLIIAADANVIDMLKLVLAKSGALAAGHRNAAALPAVPKMDTSAGVVVVDKPGAAQSVVVVAGRAPDSLRPLTPNVKAFETLFGGSFTSRLNQNLREKNGYAYGARFGVNHIDSVNPWRVSTSVATKDTGPAIGEIAKELERILTPATAAEVLRAKTYRALTFPDAFATGGDIVGFFSWAGRVGLTTSRLNAYAKELLAVDVAGLQQGATTVLTAGPRVYVIVGDRSVIDGPLQKAVKENKLGAIAYRTIDDVLAP